MSMADAVDTVETAGDWFIVLVMDDVELGDDQGLEVRYMAGWGYLYEERIWRFARQGGLLYIPGLAGWRRVGDRM